MRGPWRKYMGDLVQEWVNRGNQRQAVYSALTIPRTGGQLRHAASRNANRITLQDVRKIVRRLEAFGRVICLNPCAKTGRLYVRKDVDFAHGRMNWQLYSSVARAKVRTQVLLEVASNRTELLPRPKTATGIKLRLRDSHPTTLNMAIDTLGFLHRKGLVEIASLTPKRQCKVYALTSEGHSVVNLLNESSGKNQHQEALLPTNFD